MASAMLSNPPFTEDHVDLNSLDNNVQRHANGDHTESDHTDQEPIAIIGMGCRLPGGIDSPSKLWDLLIQGKSTQSSFPESRFNIDGFYHPEIERPGSITTAGGYFLDQDIRAFDNDFFGINNVEAMYMDPEQRKLLEVVFECFEGAGITLQEVSGANIGCYVGKFTYDYLMVQNKDPEYLHRYSATGMSTTILANRISHVFDLQGPSLVLDTACSSSLYCLHLACTALNTGECDSAIVAGANLIQSPEQHIATMKAGVLSPTSACHTFDATADGYGRGESIGALYIKKLSKALSDGDPIRSIIRGTAANSNGRTLGITLPSAARQEEVIRKAYSRAGIPYLMTDYVESHGTGTPVGDPIEVEALSRVFQRPLDEPLLIGSVKPNVGHSEAASAITSIIKVTLALEKGEIPKTFGVANLNPKIEADRWNIKIVTENTPWPNKRPYHVRRASVNSFGFGGANAHAILEAAESHVPCGYSTSPRFLALARTKFILPFSASNHSSLEQRVQDLSPIISQGGVSIADLAHTLGARRSSLGVKGYALASQHSLQDDLKIQNLRTHPGRNDHVPQPLGFVFTGQGAQWPQMGLQLIQEIPSFRHTIQQLDAVLQFLPHPPSWTIEKSLVDPPETSNINHAAYSQPICTAIQVALVQLLAKWGIKPEYVIGHSSGEICAAYTAGQLSAEQAILVAYYRGYACSKATMQGAMLAVGLQHEEAMAVIESLGLVDKVKIACINSPGNTTVSGDFTEITRLRVHFQGLNVSARELKTGGKAYHSHHMLPVGQEYQDFMAAALSTVPKAEENISNIKWISTVTGEIINTNIDHQYWRTNLESTVHFSDAVKGILNESGIHFIEIGPHPVLDLCIQDIVSSLKVDRSKIFYSSTLSRGKSALNSMLEVMGNLYIHNQSVSFSSINNVEVPISRDGSHVPQGKFLFDLPNYKWKYEETLWNESRASKEFRGRRYPRHDILGSQLLGTSGAIATWRNVLSPVDVPWLKDHRIDGIIVFPAAGYLAMAIEAACQLTGTSILRSPPFHLQNVRINKALVLSGEESDRGVEIHTTLYPIAPTSNRASDKRWHFSITTFLNGETTAHADGDISLETECKPIRQKLFIKSDDVELHSVRSWYDRMSQAGLNFSGPFRSLTGIQCSRRRTARNTIATTQLTQGGGKRRESVYLLHPATIDAILHTSLIATAAGVLKDFRLRIPVSIESLRIQIPPSFSLDEPLIVHSLAKPIGQDSMTTSIEVCSHQHGAFIQVKNCRLDSPFQDQQSQGPERQPMLKVAWKPDFTAMDPDATTNFSAYMHRMSLGDFSSSDDVRLQGIFAAVDLVTHKKPGSRIAEIGNEQIPITHKLLEILQFNTVFKRCMSYARFTDFEKANATCEHVQISPSNSYEFSGSTAARDKSIDLIIYFQPVEVKEVMCPNLEQVRGLLCRDGIILGYFNNDQISVLKHQGFSVSYLARDESMALIIARQTDQKHLSPTIDIADGRNVVLVSCNPNRPFNDILATGLLALLGRPVTRVHFDEVSMRAINPGSIVISTIELYQPILASITTEDLEMVKMLTNVASLLLWVTGGDLLGGTRPDFAIVSGLSRAVMLEQPALKFLVFDVDDPIVEPEHTISNICFTLDQGLREDTLDYEFVQHQGTLHVSRFIPETALNSAFRRKQALEASTRRLEDTTPCQLSFGRYGQLDTAYFKMLEHEDDDLRHNFVEIAIKSVDLDTYSMDTLLGKTDTECGALMMQTNGVVTKVGREVTSLGVDDRIVALAPGHFVTQTRLPEWACIKLQDEETNRLGHQPLYWYSTAIHALHHCARIDAGDATLVSMGASSLGLSAIQIARLAGAEVFSITTTQAEEDFLVEEMAMKRSHLFNSKDPSLLDKILAATNERGVQIVLGSSTDDVFRSLWEACADFGYIIEIDERYAKDATQRHFRLPRQSVSFACFNMHDLFDVERNNSEAGWGSLLKESLAVVRAHKLRPILPAKHFDVAEIAQAFQYLQSRSQTGRIVISLENPDSLIKAFPFKYQTMLNPKKTYFLIGCLGGLGRSMSKWMYERGARKFLFLGRTGLDRSASRDLAEYLQMRGAEVLVVKGDAGILQDVENAVSHINGPIGGVIQAAMGLDESLFTTMTHDQWHTAMAPKVLGTWNIHTAIKKKDSELEFFLMTSSVAGSVGVATETNYCASNYFLDVFARHRLKAGLPAICVGLGMISEIGYLHEHPGIQNSLVQKGVSSIDSDDFLQIIDVALSTSLNKQVLANQGDFSSGHILTGLEPLGLYELRKKGFEGIPATFDDPRAAFLSLSFAGLTNGQTNNFTRGLPAELTDAAQAGESIYDTTLKLIAKQFTNFLMMPIEKLDTSKPLAAFGMDSMLMAAVRSWFFRKFKVDLPFVTLLSQTGSIRDLTHIVTECLTARTEVP